MSRWYTRPLVALVALGFNLPAGAENRSPVAPPMSTANSPATLTGNTTLTGKERLGRKWMDEQRIDNCNVPVDKRGSRPRPSGCPHTPTG
jgi:hypothetical protein